jgi:RNA polymerase sigma-70 factor (ECF subfamily)
MESMSSPGERQGRHPSGEREGEAVLQHAFVVGLYERHVGELVVALALSLGDRQAAEDLTHEVFVRALAREEQLYSHPDPRGWLFRTGYNLARNRWNVLLRRRRRLEAYEPVLPTQDWDELLDVRAALGKLSPRQRDVVVLHLYVGYGIEEVAALLGVADGTVRSHLARGRAALGHELEKETST